MTSKTQTITLPWVGILFLVFLILKLTGNIDWSWVWVFSPLWIMVGFIVAVSVIYWVTGSISRRDQWKRLCR